MKAKKSKKASLEGKRFLFLQIGLVVAASISLMAFEWVSLDRKPLYMTLEEDNTQFTIVPEFVPEEVQEKIVEEKEIQEERQQDDNTSMDDNNDADLNAATETEEAEDGEEPDKGMLLLDPKDAGDIDLGIKKPKAKLTYGQYDKLTQNAEFPGGMDKLYPFLYSKIKYPRIPKKLGKEGKVFIEFIIDKNGNVADIKVLKTFDDACAQEAVNALKSMPKWTPGEQFGYGVNVRFQIPIEFELQ